MGQLNLNDPGQIPDYPGRGRRRLKAYVSYEGIDALAPIYRDKDLTDSMAQPLVSDEDGIFEICHTIDGTYGLKITTKRGRVLYDEGGLRLYPEKELGYARVFNSIDDLLADTTLGYDEARGQQLIVPGNFVRVMSEDCSFCILPRTDPTYHLETGSGLRLHVVGSDWPAAAFGIVADSDPEGQTGTDNAPALARLASALATRSEATHVTFPRGVIRSSETFNVESDAMREVHIAGDGTHIVFTHPTPATNRRYFSVRHTGTSGARCSVRGMTLDLVRNPIRTGGSDMLSVGGFSDVDISDVVIPSADNMAIAVDRALVTEARSVRIQNNRIGGKPPVTGTTHEYGSIGDTGIWVLHAGHGTVITGNVIYGTGDDAVAVAETAVSHAYSPALISNNIVKNCQGTAYKSGAAYTIFSSNYAENTVNDMYRIIDLSTNGGGAVPNGFQITGGYGKDIGRGNGANLHVDTVLSASHPCGVHVQNATGNGSIVGLHLINTAGEAVKLTTTARSLQDIEIRSCIFDEIGEVGGSVIRRDGSNSPHAVTGLTVAGNIIRDTDARLLAWECRLTNGTEGDLLWYDNEVVDCDFSGNTTMFSFGGNKTENLVGIRIRGDQWNKVQKPPAALIDINDADAREFEFWFLEDGNLTALPLGHVRFRNNQSPGAIGLGPDCRVKRGCRKTIPGTREFNADNVLLTLDPNQAWEIEAKAVGNATASFDTIAFKTTWDPVRSRAVHTKSTAGGPASDCMVELVKVTPSDPEDQVFDGVDVLQLQGTAIGWTSGGAPFDPLIQFHVTWRRVVDAGTPVKVK